MTKEQLAVRIKEAANGRTYCGELSGYAISSIIEGRSSYPVSNLISYCNGIDIQFAITDINTDECYDIDDIMDVHNVVEMLMSRYMVDYKLVYRKTAVHYTAPKNGQAPLSINTLLAVCSVLHCKLDFVSR